MSKGLTEQQVMMEVYKDMYHPDIVDSENRIYLSDGMYLCENGDLVED